MKYIDADKLRAEINAFYTKYKAKFHQNGDSYHLGIIDGLDMAERILDTLEEPVSEDLEEEISTWIPTHISGGDDEVWRDTKNAITEWAGIVARHFAKWQKAKMMKEAEECELYWDGDFLAIDLNMQPLGYSENDKVKIIIVKEDNNGR